MSLPLPDPADASALPDLAGFRRPRLRDDVPILWRGESSIQLGDDVVIDRVTRSHVAWMTSLDGLASPADLEESLTIPAHEARRLVRALLAAGAIDDAARIPATLRWAPQEQQGCRRRSVRRRPAHLPRPRCGLRGPRGTRPVLGGGHRCRQPRGGRVGGDARPPGSRSATRSTRPSRSSRTRRTRTCPATSTMTCRTGRTCTSGSWATARSSARWWCPASRPACGAPTCTDGTPTAAWPLLSVQWAQAVQSMTCPPIDPLLVQLAAAQAGLLVRRWADAPERASTPGPATPSSSGCPTRSRSAWTGPRIRCADACGRPTDATARRTAAQATMVPCPRSRGTP